MRPSRKQWVQTGRKWMAQSRIKKDTHLPGKKKKRNSLFIQIVNVPDKMRGTEYWAEIITGIWNTRQLEKYVTIQGRSLGCRLHRENVCTVVTHAATREFYRTTRRAKPVEKSTKAVNELIHRRQNANKLICQ